MSDDYDDGVRQLARRFAKAAGAADPDVVAQLGQPVMYGVSAGVAFEVKPELAEPLWRLYTDTAMQAITMARVQIEQDARFEQAAVEQAAE